jgi:hypothetical protein
LAAKRKSNTRADKDNAAKKGRGKSDTKVDAKYNNKEDVLPLTDVAFGEKQWEQRRLLRFMQPQSLRCIALNSCRGLSHPNQQMRGQKRPRVPPLHLFQCEAAE